MAKVTTALALLLIAVLTGCAAPRTATQSNATTPASTATPLSIQAAEHALARLAYLHDGDIWVKDLPGGAERRLTMGGRSSTPRWSPSGRWLAYCRDDELHVVRGSGGEDRALGLCSGAWSPAADVLAYRDSSGAIHVAAMGAARERVLAPGEPVWSPDGAWLAYVGEEPAGTPQEQPAIGLWRTRAEGGAPELLFSPGRPPEYGMLPAGWYGDQVLFWIDPAFSASILADGVPLHAIPATGGSPRELVAQMLTYADFLSIAPDGKTLAVAEGGSRETWTHKRIAVVDLASGRQRPLTSNGMAAMSPTWSPDSRRIAYVAAPDIGMAPDEQQARAGMAQRRIWVMDRDGAQQRQLTADPAYRDERPRWLPDGRHLLFVRLDRQDRAGLWLMRDDGSALQQVADLGMLESAPEPPWMEYFGHIEWDAAFALGVES